MKSSVILEPSAEQFADLQAWEANNGIVATPEQILQMAAQVYAGLTPQEIAEVEKIALNRSHFAGERQPA